MSFRENVIKLSNRMLLISRDKSYIYVKAKYGPSRIVKLPLKLGEDLTCFIAVVIGDGYLSKEKFRTTIECCNKNLLEALSRIVKLNFDIEPTIKEIKKRPGKLQTYHLSIYSKAVQELLNLVLKIPRGKKSNVVRVPEYIIKSNPKLCASFIIGLLAAEGSRKGKNYLRICSASRNLLEDTKKMLKQLKLSSKINSWINKKYKKEYYSLSFERNLKSLMRGCRSGQTGLILSLFNKAIGDQA